MIALLLFFASTVDAAKGVVVLYKAGCSYYIVETNLGFAILEWYGGSDPSEGDVLVGDYESYGMKTIDLSPSSLIVRDESPLHW